MVISELKISPEGSAGQTVSAIAAIPDDAFALLVYAHGAGAPMRHPFMEATAAAFCARGLATLRFNFPYSEAGSRRPDRQPALIAAIRAAVTTARDIADVLLLAGGKSMGGRMCSHAELAPLGVCGLLFAGYPLHAPAKPGTSRADHLDRVDLPMLFLQGTRDKLADLALIRSVCTRLGARATLHVVEGADHGFHVLKRSGRSDAEVLAELADTAEQWARSVVKTPR